MELLSLPHHSCWVMSCLVMYASWSARTAPLLSLMLTHASVVRRRLSDLWPSPRCCWAAGCPASAASQPLPRSPTLTVRCRAHWTQLSQSALISASQLHMLPTQPCILLELLAAPCGEIFSASCCTHINCMHRSCQLKRLVSLPPGSVVAYNANTPGEFSDQQQTYDYAASQIAIIAVRTIDSAELLNT